jgi:transposase
MDWNKQHECTHVAMQSTGVFWKPVVNLLDAEDIEFLVVNAQHIKAVPGRKTDVKDAEWIAKLLRHGLLKASFVPDRDQRELRELVRYRLSISLVLKACLRIWTITAISLCDHAKIVKLSAVRTGMVIKMANPLLGWE